MFVTVAAVCVSEEFEGPWLVWVELEFVADVLLGITGGEADIAASA